MKTISIPYYTSTLDLHVDEANLKAVVTAKMHEYKAGKTEVELVHEALEHPIASPRLRDLAKGKQKVAAETWRTTPASSLRTRTPLSYAALYSMPVPTAGDSVTSRGTA